MIDLLVLILGRLIGAAQLFSHAMRWGMGGKGGFYQRLAEFGHISGLSEDSGDSVDTFMILWDFLDANTLRLSEIFW